MLVIELRLYRKLGTCVFYKKNRAYPHMVFIL